MIDRSNYITEGFYKTVSERFPEKAKSLFAEYDKRLETLFDENKDASNEKMRHLKAQILPGIAAYEVFQTVTDKENAFQIVHSFTENHAREARKKLDKLMRIPGLYRFVPALFAKGVKKIFNEAAGFGAKTYQERGGVWRMDMIKCPYFDTCSYYGCPELCTCFCDSDDVTYDNLHKKLLWHRTKTLGRGDDCCDFCMKINK